MLDGLNTYWWLLGLAAVAVVFFFVLSAFSGWRQARRDRRATRCAARCARRRTWSGSRRRSGPARGQPATIQPSGRAAACTSFSTTRWPAAKSRIVSAPSWRSS